MDRTAPLSVTAAESVLMEALWRFGPLSPSDLIAAIKAQKPWADPTIKTLIFRLAQRGAIKSERRDKRLCYVPQLDRDAYLKQQVDELVGRLFDGDRQKLIAYLNNSEA
ncbi:MAG: BlaI/MecI/CopY family transcriptional regulator [Asticcacaulis sp.]